MLINHLFDAIKENILIRLGYIIVFFGLTARGWCPWRLKDFLSLKDMHKKWECNFLKIPENSTVIDKFLTDKREKFRKYRNKKFFFEKKYGK